MKHIKALAGILLAVMMLVTMTTTVFASSITIEGGHADSEYAAYKLLSASLPTEGDTSGTYNFAVNATYLTALQTVTGKTAEEDIVDYIDALEGDAVRDFADAVYLQIQGMTADYTTTTNKFDAVDMGYYLIAETKTGDKADTYSLIMLDTAAANSDADITVNTKEDKPTVDKQIEEVNDSTGETAWGESADHDLNDVINYRIIGTVSSKYADYLSYYYSFADTMEEGLDMNDGSVKVTVNGIDITASFTVEYEAHAFTATSNLKEITTGKDADGNDVAVTIDADDEILVTYTATLNENATTGENGNENEVILYYENNPYHAADGDTDTHDKPDAPGETHKDICIAFTYNAVINKIDEDGNALSGAGFTLYKWFEDQNDWVQIGEELNGVTTFEYRKLDAGLYKVAETTVPVGYNKADDIVFEIAATYDLTQDPVTLTALEVKDEAGSVISGNDKVFIADAIDGNVTTDIVNKAGVQLPSTGGIGTTVFYVVGGILIVGAVVLLITKRRMGTNG